MDSKPDFVENFEEILKQHSTRIPTRLYSSRKDGNTVDFRSEINYTPKDIIRNISAKIKAMQNADCVTKSVNKVLQKHKTSNFVPVNKLQIPVVSHTNAAKFETQFVLDTQLMNVIEDVEAMSSHKGITQEFDSTFDHTNIDLMNNRLKPPGDKVKDCSKDTEICSASVIKSPDKSVNMIEDNKTNEDSKEFKCIADTDQDKDIKTLNIYELSSYKPLMDDHCTALLDRCMEIEENVNIQDLITDTGINPSPIMNITKVEKSNNTSPLVYNLDTFEKFERIALPIIEDNNDIDKVKHLINSQIIGKELFIQTDFEPELSTREESLSPILKITKTPNTNALKENFVKPSTSNMRVNEFKETVDNIMEDSSKTQNNMPDFAPEDKINLLGNTLDNLTDFITKNSANIQEKKSVSYEDEILFSSDEENDIKETNLQDLPFTCALETSFYEHSDVLDTTMYVGFQTASNKSIQVSTVSFSKAKSILDDEVDSKVKVPTLKELVEKCDTPKAKIKFISGNAVNTTNIDTNNFSQNKVAEYDLDLNVNAADFVGFKTANGKTIHVSDKKIDKAKCFLNDINDDTNKNLLQGSYRFDGFKTASNKNIHLSEEALKRCKRVFQDINLDDDFSDDNLQCENEPCTKKIRHSLEHDKVAGNDAIKAAKKEICHSDIPNIDEDILQEFEGDMPFNDNKDNEGKQLIGVKTASNKNITISDTTFENPQNILGDIDFAETFNTKISYNSDKFNNDHNFSTKYEKVGFKTASNKIINISDKAFAQTKIIFQDIDICDSGNTSSNTRGSKKVVIYEENIKNDVIDGKSNFVGLQTASNKPTKVSEDAISKSKNMFQDIEYDEVENFDTQDNVDNEIIKAAEIIDFNKPSTSKESFGEFRTAINKKIAISTAAIEKTKNMFQDLDNLQVVSHSNFTEELDIVKLIQDRKLTEEFDKDFKPSSDMNKPGPNIHFEGSNEFKEVQTASNKSFEVSKDPVIKNKSFFQDLLNEKAESKEKGFKGFHTASNKKIQISDVALAKSKRIFEDLEENEDESTFLKFQTAINKNVKITDQILSKGNKNSVSLDKDNKEMNKIQLSPTFKDFQTSSRKDIKISAAALANSKKIFDDLNTDNKESVEAEKSDKTPVFTGFQTASNKKVIISDQALAKSRQIFDDLDIGNKEFDVVEKSTENKVFTGFQTASNKKVKISDQALAKSRKIFENMDKDIEAVDEGEKSNKTTSFKGFQTASNTQVIISETALARSRKLFEDLNEVIETDSPISQVIKSKSVLRNLGKKGKDTTKFIGFQTASNKKVNISVAALEKSKKIFEDIDIVKESDVLVDKNISKPSLGFQKANNKALAKGKKLFEGLEEEKEREANLDPLFPKTDKCDGFPNFRGFNTASNKEVKVSAEALAKSRNIFQDLNEFKENETIIPGNPKVNIFKGFQTGSNKKVVVSKEALANSRQILSDIKVNENTKPSFTFKTANNNNIKVSEEALIKSKQLSTDTDKTDDIIPNSCVIKLKTDLFSKSKADINIDKLIDTQIIKNFDESLNTEDFRTPVNRSKRSGSPILSCPRAKKMKFATPYKKGNIQDMKKPLTKQIEMYDDSYKKHKKYTLKDIAKLENNSNNTEINTDFDMNAINLDNFEFTTKRNDISDTKMSLEELKVLFLKSVNQKLVPDGWYENHIKLILWKLISYEMKFPKMMSGICTAKNVMSQLKYRYYKELYSAERPALRRILERDDVASKIMVLCVMEIYNEGGGNSATNPPELLLTDGWYSVKTCIDKMLAKHVDDGKIRVGTKIVTQGAELANCEQGVAPWEDISSVRLKIFGNSTRRARWDAKLGYHKGRGVMGHLSSVTPEGGKVSTLRVLVTRVYPPLYVEKFEDGSTVTRSERLEHIHQAKHETDRQALMEKIYEEVEKEMSDEDSPDTEEIDISKRSLDSGSQIARLMKMSKEPSQFRATLTESQRRLLEAYTASKRDKLLQDIQDRIQSRMAVVTRNVVPLLKTRIAEVSNGKIHKALLSIWKPNDALSELITEGAYIEILNVVPTAVRYAELQLSAGRQTIFKQTKKLPENLQPYIPTTLNRACYPIKEITSHPNMVTDYNEIDTVGMVIQIDPSYQDFKNINQFQNVYLTDEEKNIICVNFWGGIKKFGFENVLDTGQIVACVNLQKRAGNTRKSIPQYRATEFTYFTKTPKSAVARNFVDDFTKRVKNTKDFVQECLVVKNNLLKSHVSNEVSPYRFLNHDLSKNKIYIESPLARIQPKIQDEFNLSGLDFESTFRQTEPQELSPKSLLRKKRIHEKISKLKMYGEPPPLSPINIINQSKNAIKSFKSPLLNSSVASKSDTPVANVQNLPENRGENEFTCSPVLGISRTLKKCVNPVKLDFNKVAIEENDSVDHFAEEFDASPPLSLD